jgi:hypothetical protein
VKNGDFRGKKAKCQQKSDFAKNSDCFVKNDDATDCSADWNANFFFTKSAATMPKSSKRLL